MRVALSLFVGLLVSVPAVGGDLLVGDAEAITDALGNLRGKPVVVNYWATWCKPCVHELPLLVKAHEQWAERGIEFYGVSFDTFVFEETDAKERVEDMTKEYAVPYSQAMVIGDLDRAQATFGIGGALPTTVFLDAEGNEVDRITGLLTEESLGQGLEKLLP